MCTWACGVCVLMRMTDTEALVAYDVDFVALLFGEPLDLVWHYVTDRHR